MEMEILLPKAEKLLSEAWGREVDLSILEQQDNHPHVARLAVRTNWTDAPQTVILKRWRGEGDEGFHPEFSTGLIFNDWAGLESLRTIMGDESPAPQIYAGDKEDGLD
jgi:hypothetical protein